MGFKWWGGHVGVLNDYEEMLGFKWLGGKVGVLKPTCVKRIILYSSILIFTHLFKRQFVDSSDVGWFVV